MAASKLETSRRICLFVKANADLCDPIYGVRFSDGSHWGGLGAALRELGWPITARVRHETSACFSALADAPVQIPEDVHAREKDFGVFPPSLQYSEAVFDGHSDAVLLSIQPDIGALPAQHLASGLRFLLHNERNWPNEALIWRSTAFRRVPPITPEAAIHNLMSVVKRLQQSNCAHIMVANMSSAVPGDSVHAYLGFPETLSHRIRRFNLALVDAAQGADFSVIDIDRIVAQGGAERLLVDPVHFTRDGCRRIALEVARILEDRGVIEI